MFTIYAVSDSIGETAEQVAKASASQFKEEIEIKRVSYIKTIDDVNEFVKRFDKDKNCMVISTIVTMDIREFLVERCIEKRVRIINTLGPCISMLSAALGSMPEYKPGAVWNIDADYYKKIEAMEFAIQYDDSKNNKGILNADLVILGLSRTSKTVLCMYLANKGIKAINVPLMPEVPIPEELFKIDPKKIIGLTIDPMELIDIRKNRLQKFQMLSSDIQYANAERILDELEFADRVMRRLRCKVIDITKRAIEDTATIILKYIEKK